MAQRKKSRKGKGQYLLYKNQDRYKKNKLKKKNRLIKFLEKKLKKFPGREKLSSYISNLKSK